MKTSQGPQENRDSAIVRLRLKIVSLRNMKKFVMQSAAKPARKTEMPSKNPSISPKPETRTVAVGRKPPKIETNANNSITLRSDGSLNNEEYRFFAFSIDCLSESSVGMRAPQI
jgi:hypothetical protein